MDHDVVGGDAPNAADLQIGSGLALILTVGDVATRSGAAACDLAPLVPGLPGARAGGALPAEWFRERTSTAAG